MKILHTTGREVHVGDWLSIKDYKGRTHRYEVIEFEPLMVRVIEHHNDMKLYTSLPYYQLKLRTPYVE
jgi:hypothetical protein